MDDVQTSFSKWRNRISTPLLEAFIFHLLSLKDRFGGELVLKSQEIISREIKVPTIYAILKRSTDLGLLAIKQHDVKLGVTRGTSRKYYTLTAYGRDYSSLQVSHLSTIISTIDLSITKHNGGQKIESK